MEKKEKKTTSIVKKDDNPLKWGGVMTPANTNEEKRTREACAMVAKVYGVPPMGVNMMGSQPYLNKDGRLYLLSELRKGKNALEKIETEYLKLSLAPTEPAICKKRLVFKDGTIVEGIGEASQDNVKLAAVKLTLNMMAETRALNRAIWQAIAGDTYNRVAKNLKKENLSEEQAAMALKAGEVSAEEMNFPTGEGRGTGLRQDRSNEESYNNALTAIAQATNMTLLQGFSSRVKTQKNFNVEQKDQLLRLIGNRIKEFSDTTHAG